MVKSTSKVFFALLLLIAASTASLADSAKDMLAAGRVDEVITELNGHLSSSTADAESSNLLCRAYFALENWDRAESSCRKAVALAPDNGRYHLWLGRVYGEKADRSNFLAAAGLAG
jgi:cytochrome c-type biogenesis protein CcmH/NrfG